VIGEWGADLARGVVGSRRQPLAILFNAVGVVWEDWQGEIRAGNGLAILFNAVGVVWKNPNGVP
jgi:hypothetical protein